MGQVYGGQVAAQGLLAAGLTTELVYEPHSLHAYSCVSGTTTSRSSSRSTALRDGSSFVTRRVLARQSHGVILNLSASFQRVEDEPEAQRVEIPTSLRRARSRWIPGSNR